LDPEQNFARQMSPFESPCAKFFQGDVKEKACDFTGQ
jgi:hypothetical protein